MYIERIVNCDALISYQGEVGAGNLIGPVFCMTRTLLGT